MPINSDKNVTILHVLNNYMINEINNNMQDAADAGYNYNL